MRLGKLPAARELVDDLPQLLAAHAFELLPITFAMACTLAPMEFPTAIPLIACWQRRPSWSITPS